MFVHYTVCLTSSVHPLDPILASLDVLPVVSEVDLPLLEPDTYSGIRAGFKIGPCLRGGGYPN